MEELFGEKKTEPIAFSTTYNQKREALTNALDPIIITDEDGNYVEETRFYVEDFDDEFVFVERYYWTANDFEMKHGRYSYVFDDVSIVATISGDFEEMFNMRLTADEKAKLEEDRAKYEAVSTEFSTYKSEHSYTNSEYEILKNFEEKVNIEKRESEEKEVFADYENEIGNTTEFSELKNKSKDFSIEDLKKECLCIVGLYARANKKIEKPDNSKTKKEIKFSLESDVKDPDSDPYGGLKDKYLK